nr:helix-turn-helix transcriptional regulator [Sutcliffiella horikoshii]
MGYNYLNKIRSGGLRVNIKLIVTLDKVLKEKDMTQKELVELIKDKTGESIRPASVSELYNNQRKSLNRELIELIASVLEIDEASKLIEFKIN